MCVCVCVCVILIHTRPTTDFGKFSLKEYTRVFPTLAVKSISAEAHKFAFSDKLRVLYWWYQYPIVTNTHVMTAQDSDKTLPL